MGNINVKMIVVVLVVLMLLKTTESVNELQLYLFISENPDCSFCLFSFYSTFVCCKVYVYAVSTGIERRFVAG